jgi:hypothetical protein
MKGMANSMVEKRRCRLKMYNLGVFQICVQGALDDNWSDYFGAQSMSVETDEEGIATTCFVTEEVDQCALIGLINQLSGRLLPLLSVECLSVKEMPEKS